MAFEISMRVLRSSRFVYIEGGGETVVKERNRVVSSVEKIRTHRKRKKGERY
jgi:hypothetical protein